MIDASAEAAARAALALAATYQRAGRLIDARVQGDILAEVMVLLEREDALRRRDAALVRAYALLGSVRILHDALRRFEADIWPLWRWCADPPEGAAALRRELFAACRAASAAPSQDGEMNLPGERQLRRIVTSRHSDVTEARAG